MQSAAAEADDRPGPVTNGNADDHRRRRSRRDVIAAVRRAPPSAPGRPAERGAGNLARCGAPRPAGSTDSRPRASRVRGRPLWRRAPLQPRPSLRADGGMADEIHRPLISRSLTSAQNNEQVRRVTSRRRSGPSTLPRPCLRAVDAASSRTGANAALRRSAASTRALVAAADEAAMPPTKARISPRGRRSARRRPADDPAEAEPSSNANYRSTRRSARFEMHLIAPRWRGEPPPPCATGSVTSA